ncbi:MAG TPA: NAD(P)/FAD-dependent oxidoreductase [Ktedonobacterales bacterium]|nr:NAD(P)/FAD-dependent oxidoreductase [Ktedonobacterales bacterium]
MILVIGSGLAGLTCAKVLVEAGHDVRILEASDRIGGRVRTDASADGFLLDRGFQALLTAYPAVQRHLDLKALRPRTISPRVVLIRNGKWHRASSRFSTLGTTFSNSLLTFGDKLRMGRLRRYARRRSQETIFHGKLRGFKADDVSIRDELLRRHFSEKGFIENFAQPFFGTIFLDRTLETSARMMLFMVKMLASGKMAIPEGGIGEIAAQLAAKLPANALRLETRVEGVVEADDRAVGVTLTGGEEMQGEAIVLAADLPNAARLTGGDETIKGRTCVCLYFASTQSLYSGPKLLLNANPDAFINHAIQLTNVSPAYGPKGQHLLSVTVLGTPEMSDEDIAKRCREEMATWFPGKDLSTLRQVGTFHIRFGQFKQQPDIFATLPPNSLPTKGLFLAGEYTESSTIHGAITSGEKAAQAVLEFLNEE